MQRAKCRARHPGGRQQRHAGRTGWRHRNRLRPKKCSTPPARCPPKAPGSREELDRLTGTSGLRSPGGFADDEGALLAPNWSFNPPGALEPSALRSPVFCRRVVDIEGHASIAPSEAPLWCRELRLAERFRRCRDLLRAGQLEDAALEVERVAGMRQLRPSFRRRLLSCRAFCAPCSAFRPARFGRRPARYWSVTRCHGQLLALSPKQWRRRSVVLSRVAELMRRAGVITGGGASCLPQLWEWENPGARRSGVFSHWSDGSPGDTTQFRIVMASVPQDKDCIIETSILVRNFDNLYRERFRDAGGAGAR